MTLSLDTLRAAPKVALHEHLDGSLRPATVLELGARIGRGLPADDPEGLGRWFFEAADSGSLEAYLATFGHTLAVMQTADHLRRVAREFVEDQAADGVVYAEVRWAPELHREGGLTIDDAVLAVAEGVTEGMAECAEKGRRIVVRQLLTSLRNRTPNTDIAEAVVRYRDAGVAGYDIAGPESGFPASAFASAFDVIRRANAHVTVHAGEGAGLESIWDAVVLCGAQRLGHGVRIVEDIHPGPDGPDGSDGPTLGHLAAYVRDQRIPLEVCPTSNLQTGICSTMVDHPIGRLVDLGFVVTVSCDNRLMSRTTVSEEFLALSGAFGYGLGDVERMTVDAARSAFAPHPVREALVRDVIRPGYDALRG